MNIAALQMTSSPVLSDNIKTVERLIHQAASEGAQLILLPEYWAMMGTEEQDKFRLAKSEGAQQLHEFMAQQAKKYGIYLIGGTIPILPESPVDKAYNSTLVFDPTGRQIARYDKIHLFRFNDHTRTYDETESIVAGITPVQCDMAMNDEHIKVGLSICYDLRFPELYRAMVGVDLIVVPAAFTYTTGSAHWEVLLRARAIENQCYVLASAQTGHHPNGRNTWGHSMLVDPWGKVVSVLPEGEGIVTGKLDVHVINEVRRNLPALQHRVLT